MRIWDLNPGYLDRQRLLGEHRELHGIVSILKNNKKGYSRHPETLRWKGFGWALKQRHRLLSAEMDLRGYMDRSKVLIRSKPNVWPEEFIDSPYDQISILGNKYGNDKKGRIPLPEHAQELWAHHKYSVMARDIELYRETGRRVANNNPELLKDLSMEITFILRTPPRKNLIENTLLHMWGYVSKYSENRQIVKKISMKTLLKRIQTLSISNNIDYLIHSTALSELGAWDY